MPAPTQPSSDLRAQILAFERLGFDPDALCVAAGLDRRDLDDPDTRFPYEVSGAVLRAAREQKRLSHLGLRLAAHVSFGAYDMVDYLVFSSDHVREGLERLARYFATVTQAVSLQVVEDHDDGLRLEVHDILGHPGAFRFVSEYTVGIVVRRLHEGTGGRFRARYAAFPHDGDEADELGALFGCAIRFGTSWTGLAFSRVAGATPFERRDPVLRRLLEAHARDLDGRLEPLALTTAAVRRTIAAELARGDTRIGSVARGLGTSARTLQRQLQAHGLSYQQLLDEARREAALQHLRASSLAISEIAYLLGYSEPSAFHRAFRRWTGRAPSELRAVPTKAQKTQPKVKGS